MLPHLKQVKPLPSTEENKGLPAVGRAPSGITIEVKEELNVKVQEKGAPQSCSGEYC